MKQRWQFGDYILFLLPLSLFWGSVRLPHVPLPVYFPEIVALLYIGVHYQVFRVKQIRSQWFDFPLHLRVAFVLLGIGLVTGVVFAPSLAIGLGAAKSWFIVPVLVGWVMVAKKQSPLPLYYGVILYALLLTFFGWFTLHGEVNGRLQGNFESANYYSAVVAPAILVATFLARKQRLLWIAVAILLGGLLLSQSLGGFIGVVGGCAFWGAKDLNKQARRWTGIIILILLVTGVFIGRHRFANLQNSSLSSRIQIWNTAGYLGKIYPFSGTGLRGFPSAYAAHVQTLYPIPQEWVVPEPHDLYLAFWLDTGLAGILGLIGLFAWVFKGKRLIPAQLALVAIAAHGLVDTPFFKTELAFLFWLYLAVMIVTYAHEE